jgi:hypothetical protein
VPAAVNIPADCDIEPPTSRSLSNTSVRAPASAAALAALRPAPPAPTITTS